MTSPDTITCRIPVNIFPLYFTLSTLFFCRVQNIFQQKAVVDLACWWWRCGGGLELTCIGILLIIVLYGF